MKKIKEFYQNIINRPDKATMALTIALLFSLVITGVVSAVDPGPPSERNVQPELILGNPSCPNGYLELKTGTPEEIIYDDGYLKVEITDIYDTGEGQVFDWEVTSDSKVKRIQKIYVKGGPDANLYDYGEIGASWDGYLHSPINPNNGKFYGLSHVSFCYQIPPDAYITIEADDTNEVGEPHTFTVTVMEDSTADGVMGDFVPAEGETVDVTYDAFYGADDPADDSCLTDEFGQCTVTINSQNAGQIVAKASSNVLVDGLSLYRETDGVAPNSGPATKTYVDAFITIGDPATNEVGDPHTFTVTVYEDDGSGSGFQPAAGETVDVTYISSNGADPQADDICDTGMSGMCTVTINSQNTGQIVATASSDVQVGGLSLYRETDGVAPNSSPAIKTYVDAYIEIIFDDTNEVGDPHIFTVTVYEDHGSGSGFQPAAGEDVDFTLTNAYGATYDLDEASSTCDDALTNNDGQCTIVFTSNSAGQVTGHASSNISVGGISLFRETDGIGNNSDDALKIFVDAFITIMPDATNEIGDPHTFTVTVYEDIGYGNGWEPAEGENVDVTLTNANGADYIRDYEASTCDDPGPNTDEKGQCTIVFTSNLSGQVTGHASSLISVSGLSLFRETDGVSPNSDDAVKTFVDAYIEIEADDTNEVGDPHTFTVTVYEDDGSGSGFQAASGETVNVTYEAKFGADPQADDSCVTDSSGECEVTINSSSPGQIVATASSDVQVGGLNLTRVTDGLANNSGPATKTYVDARISISPDDTNGIGEPHTFTVFIEKNEGMGDGWVAGADGTSVTVELTDDATSAWYFVGDGDTCDDGTVSGYCDVTFSSDSPGVVTGHAEATILSGGLSLFRETGAEGSYSDDATKTFIAASLSWLKHNHLGQPLDGATFEVCRTHDRFGNDIVDECMTVVDNLSPDQDPDGGEFLLTGLYFGTYTIKETAAPAGFFLDPTVYTAAVTSLSSPNFSVPYIWVNRPGRAQLVPTDYDCNAFYFKTAPDLVLTYNPSGNIAPGRFFYYNLFKAVGDSNINIITYSDPDGVADPKADGVKVWIIQGGSCVNVSNEVSISIDNNIANISVPKLISSQSEASTLIFRVEYKPPKHEGVDTTFYFETRVNGSLVLSKSIMVYPQ